MTGCVNGQGEERRKGKRARSPRARSPRSPGLDATPGRRTRALRAAVAFADALRVGDGFILADLDPRSTPAFDGDKAAGEEALAARAGEISSFQERLYAESKGGVHRSLLLVVQGMDTSGKGGIMRHVVGQMDPQGVHHTAFKAPTAEERKHPFLWRIRNALPAAGQVGVFDRSHYEDVLIVRVHELVPRAIVVTPLRPDHRLRVQGSPTGTTIVKVMLHISPDEQKARLTERLEREDKHWKYRPGDVDERLLWPAVPGGLPGCPREDLHRRRPVVRRSGRPQVVRPAGRAEPRPRAPREAWTRSGRRPTSTSRRRSSGWPSPDGSRRSRNRWVVGVSVDAGVRLRCAVRRLVGRPRGRWRGRWCRWCGSAGRGAGLGCCGG